MSTHEFTFGGVPCLIVTSGLPSTAVMYVIVDDGAALQPVANQDGVPVELESGQALDSLARAVGYLTARFGEREKPRDWNRKWWYLGRTVLEDQPLRDERPR